VSKTLLAVDDSVTMRKVLEITFSGEDFSVVTVDNSQAALAADAPNIAVIDTVLGNEDGYALAKELRKRAPTAAIIMLASRYAPYDQARGRDAGADDWADKPFDTQQLIDKVRKIVLAKEAGGPTPVQAAGSAPAIQPAAAPAPTPIAPAVTTGSGGTGGFRPNPTPASAFTPAGASTGSGSSFGLGRGTQPSLGGAPAPGPMPARAPAAAPAATAAATPAPAPVAAAPVAAEPPAPSPVATAVNGQLAAKLGGLGLTQQQADAVLALSREVVEKIVWEVVPQLAEAIIKEEIARLTKEA
jgi:CheY-like chemotaxis protein